MEKLNPEARVSGQAAGSKAVSVRVRGPAGEEPGREANDRP